jgi:hypothetical protein
VKKCGELNYLTSKAFWNIIDFGAKCEKCETINTITLENGELRKQIEDHYRKTYRDNNHICQSIICGVKLATY